MTERQLEILVDSVMGDEPLNFELSYGGDKLEVTTQNGRWVAAVNHIKKNSVNFFIWPEFVEYNGVYNMMPDYDQKKLLNGIYRRIASMAQKYMPKHNLDEYSYCCKLTGWFLFLKL
jgi:hypothetical protein